MRLFRLSSTEFARPFHTNVSDRYEEEQNQNQDLLDRSLLPRPWGCPTYVLEPNLRDGGKIPKWQPKSRRGQFVGFSQTHASTVGLVRNLRSGTITPQFHCVYDPEFQTVHASDGQPPPTWVELFEQERYLTPLDPDANPTLLDEWLSPEELARKRDLENRRTAPLPLTPEMIPFNPTTAPVVRPSIDVSEGVPVLVEVHAEYLNLGNLRDNKAREFLKGLSCAH